ncbi:MAG: carboxypeptidase-like regulatory domain-containing protein [Cyclobacteriaceae bacterium]
MKYLSYLYLLIASTFQMNANAQTLRGQVVDSLTRLPIAYANIGVIGKNAGTVSDETGKFELALSALAPTDTLRISMIGYSTKDYILESIHTSGEHILFNLSERAYELKEIIVKPSNSTNLVLGIAEKSCYPIPLYKGARSQIAIPSNELGQEIGTRFTNKVGLLKLDSVQLNFAKCLYDTVTFRLNIYSISKTGMQNILKKGLYVSLSKDQILNSPKIDLSNENVFVDSDFAITIENIKNSGGLGLYFFANFNSKGEKYPTIFRPSSHSNWTVLKHKSKPLGISILTSVN